MPGKSTATVLEPSILERLQEAGNKSPCSGLGGLLGVWCGAVQSVGTGPGQPAEVQILLPPRTVQPEQVP